MNETVEPVLMNMALMEGSRVEMQTNEIRVTFDRVVGDGKGARPTSRLTSMGVEIELRGQVEGDFSAAVAPGLLLVGLARILNGFGLSIRTPTSTDRESLPAYLDKVPPMAPVLVLAKGGVVRVFWRQSFLVEGDFPTSTSLQVEGVIRREFLNAKVRFEGSWHDLVADEVR